jgi:hypothetical protein
VLPSVTRPPLCVILLLPFPFFFIFSMFFHAPRECVFDFNFGHYVIADRANQIKFGCELGSTISSNVDNSILARKMLFLDNIFLTYNTFLRDS